MAGHAAGGTVAYFDCFAGIAGDMALGALLDASEGRDEAWLRERLAVLPLDPFELLVEPAERGGIGATYVRVRPVGPGRSRLRTWGELRGAVEGAGLPAPVLARSLAVFERLALAEARVHRTTPEAVHFHEVGAVDTVVDVVGMALLLDRLGVVEVLASPVALGEGGRVLPGGTHGPLPVPGPAVLELLRGAPVTGGGVAAELTTPTGAAILAGSVAPGGFGPLPPLRVAAVGYGAGSRDHAAVPNVLRVVLGERTVAAVPSGDPGAAGPPGGSGGPGEGLILEANVDDMTPELAAWVVARLLEAGAADAWLTPIHMKKGRPALTLSVLCRPGTDAAVRRVLWRETTTLGVRGMPVRKWMLDREVVEVEALPGRRVRVKLGLDGGEVVNVAPEFEDCAALARATGVPLKELMARAQAAALSWLPDRGGAATD